MVPYFPQKIAHRAIFVYLISLSLVSVFFVGYPMLWEFILLGILWVTGFFLLTNRLTETWRIYPEKEFVKKLFWIAVGLRLVWVIISYFYYIQRTGQPFEFGAADSLGYHEEAVWLAESSWSFVWDYYFGSFGVSDVGYPLYLTVLYKILVLLYLYLESSRLLSVLIPVFYCISCPSGPLVRIPVGWSAS